jgi:GNAT superfamily N-acetyltransferase
VSDYRLSEDPAEIDLDRVVRWLGEEAFWSKGRSRAVIERSLAGSYPCGAFSEVDGQVAIARVVSDGATFAWLCDVYVDPEHRGRGLGSALARWAVDRAEERDIHRVVLATRDAHEVYRRVGFTPLPHPHIWMQIDHRPQRLPD